MAAFVTAYVLGVGLVKGLGSCGLKVPKDVSVVSFDDVSLARMCDPSLTTVWQDIPEKGRCAVRMILDSMRGGIGKQERILPIRLIERDSVADCTKKDG
jgi:DNA-binding LacI/PurR family transcriptional regulator